MQPGPAPAWRLRTGIVLHWRAFDDEWVVFEERVSSTHHLSALQAAVLTLYEAGAVLDLPTLLSRLEAEFGLAGVDADAQPFAALLQQLCRLDLLEPASGLLPMTTQAHAAARPAG